MECYEYLHVESLFSTAKVLRRIEQLERDGWSLHFTDSTICVLWGFGGTSGLRAVMRRPAKMDPRGPAAQPTRMT